MIFKLNKEILLKNDVKKILEYLEEFKYDDSDYNENLTNKNHRSVKKSLGIKKNLRMKKIRLKK